MKTSIIIEIWIVLKMHVMDMLEYTTDMCNIDGEVWPWKYDECQTVLMNS